MVGKPQPLRQRPLAAYEEEILSRLVSDEHYHDVRRILDRARRSSRGCLEWTGADNGNGYGTMKSRRLGRSAYVHRLMIEAISGPLVEGAYCCHRCDNRRCVEPDHLFAGSPLDNVADMLAKGRGSPPPRTDWPARMQATRHHWQKLRLEDIPEIRKRISLGHTLDSIGRDFGVSGKTISKIKNGERWSHVQ